MTALWAVWAQEGFGIGEVFIGSSSQAQGQHDGTDTRLSFASGRRDGDWCDGQIGARIAVWMVNDPGLVWPS